MKKQTKILISIITVIIILIAWWITLLHLHGGHTSESHSNHWWHHSWHIQNNHSNHSQLHTSTQELITSIDLNWTFPEEKPIEIVELNDGDNYTLEITQINKEIWSDTISMLAYNGSVPGPILKAPTWAKINLTLVNKVSGLETTLHSHGLRHDYTMDGVPKDMMWTQDPVWNWESFTYEITFPDSGIFWYHPHIREDIQQELWLAGTYIVTPKNPDYWWKVNSEEVLVLDDIFIENWKIADFSDEFANYVLMGRFGNTMLINGQTNYTLQAKKWEVKRLYLSNVSNTRTYNFEIPWVKIKRVGWDIGKYEREEFVDSIIISPAERYIVEVYFENSWTFEIQNNTPISNYTLWKIQVSDEIVEASYEQGFNTLRENRDTIQDIDNYRDHFNKTHDKELLLDIESKIPGDHAGHHKKWSKIEWEDSIKEFNKINTSDKVDWNIIDTQTGKKNMEIDWNFKKWDIVKVRIKNRADALHPMQHPIHFHGQRFLIINQNWVKNTNLVWKDTALIQTGEYIDIIIDMSNPGFWMSHCHIAEHLSSGMMMHFRVEE